jgi:hypothetical protein
MSMPEDTKGTAPEDVEAHGLKQKRDAQGEQPGARWYDASENVDDVEAHARQKRDAQGDDVPRIY